MTKSEADEALKVTVMEVLQRRCDAIEALTAERPTPENWAATRAAIMRLFDGIPQAVETELRAKA
jgi:hypothetical protein